MHRVESELKSSGRFELVWRAPGSWVVACEAFAESRLSDCLAEGRLVFLEGADELSHRYADVLKALDDPKSLVGFPGDFGLVSFNDDGSAVVVRSPSGLVPFYVKSRGGTTAISTRLGYVAQFVPGWHELEPLTTAIWLTGHCLFPDGRTFLRDVRLLAQGHLLRLKDGHSTEERYWDVRPEDLDRPTGDSFKEHAETLRNLLLKNLSMDLDSGGRNLLTFSGGVDSSCLLALSAGVLGARMKTLSLLPPSGSDCEHARSYIDPLISQYGVEESWFVNMREGDLLSMLREAPPALFPIQHPALCVLPRIAKQSDVAVMVGGEFGDHVTGSILRAPDWAAHTSLARLLLGLNKLPSGKVDLLRWIRHRVRNLLGRPTLPVPSELPELVHPEVRAEWREWQSQKRSQVRNDHRPNRFLELHTEVAGWIVMNWEATSELGIRRSVPFLTRETLELAFSCHPEELVGPGEKKLLKEALRNDVPSSHLFREDKGRWTSSYPWGRTRWEGRLPDSLEGIVRPDWFPNPPSELDAIDARQLEVLRLLGERLEILSQ